MIAGGARDWSPWRNERNALRSSLGQTVRATPGFARGVTPRGDAPDGEQTRTGCLPVTMRFVGEWYGMLEA